MAEKKSPWLAMSKAQAQENMAAVARNARGEAPPAQVDPYSRATLTGDMAANSPRQLAAQAQFDAYMRANAPPPEEPTPEEIEYMRQRDAAMRASGG